MHLAHAPGTCTLHMHLAHASGKCTLHMHLAHAPGTCTWYHAPGTCVCAMGVASQHWVIGDGRVYV
eukprot:356988-Chlamydomonas_euryale.AAC.1